jgi:hypothetical protein
VKTLVHHICKDILMEQACYSAVLIVHLKKVFTLYDYQIGMELDKMPKFLVGKHETVLFLIHHLQL